MEDVKMLYFKIHARKLTKLIEFIKYNVLFHKFIFFSNNPS